METTDKLFSDFGPITREQWKAKAIEDLKGADFDKKLVWKTDEEFSVQPFYTPEDFESSPCLQAQHKLFSSSSRSWINYTEIAADDAAEANSIAVEMKKFGARGFLFRFSETTSPELNILLKGLDPGTDAISFSSKSPSLVSLYFDFIRQNNIDISKIKGFYEFDILEQWTVSGQEPDFNVLAEVLKTTKSAPGFKGLTVRSHSFVNAGSNVKQELAFTLNKLTDYVDKLTEKGLSAGEVLNEVILHMAIGGDYFFEIAKLRALKVLLKSIVDLYPGERPEIKVISSNSSWSKSLFDPNVNMLRNTTEAMSALLGGCDALLTYPHDAGYKEASTFSRRIALNISNILKEESYFDKVSDPAAGSYYLENLTYCLTESALGLFKEIEDKGGFIYAFKSGLIQEKIEAIRDRKEKETATRKRVYVGTNKYPNLQEKDVQVGSLKDDESANGLQLLKPRRATRSFDELRTRTLANYEKTGNLPKVYLACFGNLAMRKARATFSSEFFGTAGFDILGEFDFEDPLNAAEESAKSNADIVVLCSSDQEYETSAEAFARKFKSVAPKKSLVLAGYPESIVEKLKAAGIDQFVHMKSNAIDVLTGFQRKLMGEMYNA